MNQASRALIVDDDTEICTLLCNYLADFGIAAHSVHDGAAMRTALSGAHYDVLILDLMLPGEDGLMLCRQLRAASDIYIIMLTARGELADRVMGLELGADDYMIKPFDPRELVARMHTLLRRGNSKRRRSDSGDDEDGFGNLVGFEGWQLNRIARQLTTPAKMIVPLSTAEFRLLWAFITRPCRVLSRDQLMDAARGQARDAFDRSIDLLVSRLRQKLADDPKAPRLLKTVRGEGYLFDARVVK